MASGFRIRDLPLNERPRERLINAGADALNLRVHVPGVSVTAAREQIARLGAEVLPLLRA